MSIYFMNNNLKGILLFIFCVAIIISCPPKKRSNPDPAKLTDKALLKGERCSFFEGESILTGKTSIHCRYLTFHITRTCLKRFPGLMPSDTAMSNTSNGPFVVTFRHWTTGSNGDGVPCGNSRMGGVQAFGKLRSCLIPNYSS